MKKLTRNRLSGLVFLLCGAGITWSAGYAGNVIAEAFIVVIGWVCLTAGLLCMIDTGEKHTNE